MLPIVAEAMTAEMPTGWVECRTTIEQHGTDGKLYYVNRQTEETTWDHPLEVHYNQALVVAREHQKLREAGHTETGGSLKSGVPQQQFQEKEEEEDAATVRADPFAEDAGQVLGSVTIETADDDARRQLLQQEEVAVVDANAAVKEQAAAAAAAAAKREREEVMDTRESTEVARKAEMRARIQAAKDAKRRKDAAAAAEAERERAAAEVTARIGQRAAAADQKVAKETAVAPAAKEQEDCLAKERTEAAKERTVAEDGRNTTAIGPFPRLELPERKSRDALFRRMDYNGNGVLSLAEIDKCIVELYPDFNHKPVLMVKSYRCLFICSTCLFFPLLSLAR